MAKVLIIATKVIGQQIIGNIQNSGHELKVRDLEGVLRLTDEELGSYDAYVLTRRCPAHPHEIPTGQVIARIDQKIQTAGRYVVFRSGYVPNVSAPPENVLFVKNIRRETLLDAIEALLVSELC